ncbi:MAG: YfhO family protein [Roseburia sp.]|nr:YfhO family protein [Roseburia sp.]
MEYRFVVEEEGNYYLQHISADASRVVALKAENVMDLSEQGNVVKRLGYLKPGEEILIWCFIGGDGPRSLDKVYVYHEDEDILAEYAKKINEQQIEITHEREDHITVTCNNDETRRRYVLLTIPYDAGWTVTVDGMEVTPYTAVENLMLIGVEPGEHTIELNFVPQGLQEGLAVSGAVLGILALSYIVILIRKKKHYGEKKNQF